MTYADELAAHVREQAARIAALEAENARLREALTELVTLKRIKESPEFDRYQPVRLDYHIRKPFAWAAAAAALAPAPAPEAPLDIVNRVALLYEPGTSGRKACDMIADRLRAAPAPAPEGE